MRAGERTSIVRTLVEWARELERHGHDLRRWTHPRILVARLQRMATQVAHEPAPPTLEQLLEMQTDAGAMEREAGRAGGIYADGWNGAIKAILEQHYAAVPLAKPPQELVQLPSWAEVEQRSLHDPAIQRSLAVRDKFGLSNDDIAPALILGLSDMREELAKQFAEHLRTQAQPRIIIPGGVEP